MVIAMKTYIASDFHIGSDDSNYKAISEFFDLVKKDADELILVGDTLELWTNSIENIQSIEPYKSAYEKLLETALIVKTIVVCGNHDYNIKKYLKKYGIEVHRNYTRDNVMIIHGWELDLMQVFAYPYFRLILEYFPYIYQKFLYKRHLYNRGLWSYNNIIKENALKYIKKNKYSHLIYGHTHEPYIDGCVLNCGDMVTNKSYIVIDDGDAYLRSI